MIPYYLFMGLLIVTLALWGVIAFREDDVPDEQETHQTDESESN